MPISTDIVRFGTRIMPSKREVITIGPSVSAFEKASIWSRNEMANSQSVRQFPTFSVIDGCASDKTALLAWQEEKIAQMGDLGFKKYIRERAQIGIKFHKALEELIRHKKNNDFPSLDEVLCKTTESIHGYLQSIYPVISSLPIIDCTLERTVVNYDLFYSGRFDAVLQLPSGPCLFDWKTTSERSAVSLNHGKGYGLKGLYGYPKQMTEKEGPNPSNMNLIPYEPGKRMAKLQEDAKAPKVFDTIPVERYCNALLQMYSVAYGYLKDRELEKAFILMMRYLNLAISELPTHKYFKDFTGPVKKEVIDKARIMMATASDIKGMLKEQYEREYNHHLAKINKLQEDERIREEAKKKLEMEKAARQEHARAAFMVQMRNQHSRIKNPGVTTDGIAYDSLVVSPKNKSTGPHLSLEAAVSEFNGTDVKIIIAGDVVAQFLAAAEANTRKDIETCGILCGVICNYKFVVTHVILPRQTGTANSCSSEGEEDIFAAQAEKELLTFGWIHTHPSQTAFLSSVDLHTHHAYQSAINDAIAIVCAPSYDEVGTFVITPEGMQIISGCDKKGFHPHVESMQAPIFKEANHARYHKDIKITIIDLRK